MHDWLQRVWYGGAKSGVVLLPLTWVFAALVSLRRVLYRTGILRTESVGAPVVIVGNLTVGGTGKTPLTMWLASRLRERGLRPGIVMRGYGRSPHADRDAVQLVAPGTTAAQVGDEAVMLARRTDCPVAVGNDRVAAARLLVGLGVDVIVADDGLQHLRLARGVEIAVVDSARGFGNGRLLPGGPLRESRERLRTVDAVVLNGTGKAGQGDLPGGIRFEMGLEPRAAVSLRDGHNRPLREFVSQRVHAVAGIGNPARFFDMLRTQGIESIEHAMPDHATLTPQDIDFGDGLAVLMTEKDAVKCAAFAGERHWYVPVDAVLAPGGGGGLVDLVMGKVRRENPAA